MGRTAAGNGSQIVLAPSGEEMLLSSAIHEIQFFKN